MISIAGNPADASLAGASWVGAAAEKRIVEKMLRSGTLFRYDSLEQLQFEVRVRWHIIRFSHALNGSGVHFAHAYAQSKCNPRFWIRTADGGFRLRQPSGGAAAVRDIFANGWSYSFECATAIIIVYYRALLAELGDAKFNEWFPDLYLFDGEYSPKLSLVTRETNEYLPGDEVYFKNPDFNPKTPEWQGENAIDLGDGTYWGHGIGIKPASGIIASLNRNRRRGAYQSAFLLDQATNPDYKRLQLEASGFRRLSARVGSATYLL